MKTASLAAIVLALASTQQVVADAPTYHEFMAEFEVWIESHDSAMGILLDSSQVQSLAAKHYTEDAIEACWWSYSEIMDVVRAGSVGEADIQRSFARAKAWRCKADAFAQLAFHEALAAKQYCNPPKAALAMLAVKEHKAVSFSFMALIEEYAEILDELRQNASRTG